MVVQQDEVVDVDPQELVRDLRPIPRRLLDRRRCARLTSAKETR